MSQNFQNVFAKLPDVFYTKMLAERFVQNPQLLHYNDELASLLEEGRTADINITQKKLDAAKFTEQNIFQRQNFENNLEQWIEGILVGLEPLAMVYAGHQFGQYVPRLGDGRALLLAQTIAKDNKLYDLQLKGSGLTPYSRMGDGRAVLRSCIREYLCGEAMHHLGVPSSRALTLIATKENVLREEVEQGSMILRVAKSHIRFGHFEYFYYSGQHEALKTLVDHVIENYLPQCNSPAEFAQSDNFSLQKFAQNKYHKFLQQVVTLTAEMIAKWQAFGFCHGVMNTDNMSILGETIDYGPFGFLEEYNPHHICNHSDYSGRYAYNQQPTIANWNIYALCFALQPLISLEESAKIAQNFFKEFAEKYYELMRQKIGFAQDESADEIWQNLLQIMQEEKADYTLTFSNLAKAVEGDKSTFLKLFKNKNKIEFWLENYLQVLEKNEAQEDVKNKAESAIKNHKNSALNLMKKTNPRYILRNWVLQNAIDEVSENLDGSKLDELFAMIKNPFAENNLYEKYAATAPENYRNLSVSCSS